MKTKIIVLALLLALVPLGSAMAAKHQTIYDTLKASGKFKILVMLIDKVNATQAKQMPGPFTMFAPTDEAFGRLPSKMLNNIMTKPALARNVVYFSIIPGRYLVKDFPQLKECKTLCPTANAEPLKFTKVGNKYMVNGATIIKPNVICSNGVIQVVNGVLIPQMAPPHKP
jgi:transforming growth factor-beta-induced protein